MPTAYYTPGVYVEEVDRGTKPIEGVSTSVTAFMGFTARAEKLQADGITTRSILGEPTLITNWGQYELQFGSFHRDAFLPHAVRGFFDNGGTRCYVVSVRAMAEHCAQSLVLGHDVRTGATLPVLLLRAASGGPAGNDLRAEIQPVVHEDVSRLSDKERARKRYTLRLRSSQDTADGDQARRAALQSKLAIGQEEIRRLTAEIETITAEWLAKDVDLTATGAAWTRIKKAHPDEDLDAVKKGLDAQQTELEQTTRRLESDQTELQSLTQVENPDPTLFFEFSLADLPCWSDNQTERLDWRQWQRLPDRERHPVRDGSFIDQRTRGLQVEVWKLHKQGREATILPDADTEILFDHGTPQYDYAFLVDQDAADDIEPIADAETQGKIVTQKAVHLYRGSETARKGIDGLHALDDVNLVCVPDLMKAYDVLGAEGRAQADEIVKGVQGAILTFCKRAHYPFAILDTPPQLDVQAMADWRMALPGGDTMHGALYYPWIQIPDPLDAKRRLEIPPCGHVAGIYARTDSERGVHQAPANQPVNGAVALQLNVTKNEQALLNPIGVNCIRQFPGRGIRIWGARTLAMTDPAWRYINVRRLFSYVEASVERNTQWVVFEPNDHALWSRVTRDVGAFLRTIWLSGALFGKTAEEAFYVKCDESTNLPELRDVGQMVCEIGLSPVKPAEFVIFRFTQWTADADTGN